MGSTATTLSTIHCEDHQLDRAGAAFRVISGYTEW
jgi:hypothetical protein